MEQYKALNQGDDDSESLSLPHSRERTWWSLPRWSLWFTGGFISALATMTVFAAAYAVFNFSSKELPSGLIPNCKLLFHLLR